MATGGAIPQCCCSYRGFVAGNAAGAAVTARGDDPYTLPIYPTERPKARSRFEQAAEGDGDKGTDRRQGEREK